MDSPKKEEANVKMTVYVPAEVREKVENFAEKTVRNLSSSVQYLLETHPELNQPENIQVQT